MNKQVIAIIVSVISFFGLLMAGQDVDMVSGWAVVFSVAVFYSVYYSDR